MADFGWRISMAEITIAGPFSHFPGIDRVLTVISGELNLIVEGRPPRRLTATDAPHPFPGDAGAFGTPIGGPVTDLNVMVRRGQFSAHVRAAGAGPHTTRAATCIFLALAPGDAIVAGETHGLLAHDALLLQGPASWATDCPGVLIDLNPAA